MLTSNVEILTGARPTGDLTVANYLGAIKPIIDLQNKGHAPLIFVADLHALTDSEPDKVRKYQNEIVADYLALGVDPKLTKIFVQSAIASEVLLLTAYLARLISGAELLRVPTLKDKLRNNENPELANALLLMYPVMMAADILVQRAKTIPVGEDQLAHLEVARDLARRFNKKYGEVFPVPQPLTVESLRVMALKGEGKMSKSVPNGAIFLTDTPEQAQKKIKTAETAFGGEWNDRLKSHILIAKNLAKTDDERQEIDSIIAEHMSGKAVMGQFKANMAEIVINFLREFQAKRAQIVSDSSYVPSVLEEGKNIAKANADKTMALVEQAMFGN